MEAPGIEALRDSLKMVLQDRHLAVFLDDSRASSTHYVAIWSAQFRFKQLPQVK